MGRAGGGSRGGGGRSGGGSFSRSSSGRSSSSFSRSSSSRRSSSSYSRSSSRGGSSFGGSSFGGGFGGFGGSSFGGSFTRSILNGSGRKTVIINNSGNKTYTGTNTSSGNRGSNTYNAGTYGSATAQTYAAPKELTPEQKINRAERLASEAREARKSSVTLVLIGIILLVVGLFVSMKTKSDVFEKHNLKGTVDAGYAYDDGFTYNGGKTEKACKEFYQETGIPLYFYTVDEYKENAECDAFTIELYDKLFKDENHVLIAYYNNEGWWSWAYGANVSYIMAESEINDLIDEIYKYWDDNTLTNDAVLAKGIEAYQKKLTSGDSGAELFAGLLLLGGGILLIVAVFRYTSKGKEAKRYEEEAETIRTELILSKPLETFGDQEVEDLKDKYDNM